MSDTHITDDPNSCRLVRKAFELFKKHKVDLVVNAGDIGESHTAAGYRNYRAAFNEVFAGTMVRDVVIYANHDQLGVGNWEKACRLLKKNIEAANEPYDQLEIKGYPVLIFPEFMDFERYRRSIADAVRRYPGKPVFVLDHVPAWNTVEGSVFWGCRKRRRILNDHPQVVHISGHVHGSLRNELKIWQQEFTAVNAGCLSRWEGSLTGYAPKSKQETGVMIMEVFPEKIVFRRYDVSDGREYHPDKPWQMPLPFQKTTAPYRFEARKNGSPEFPAGAKLDLSTAQWQKNKLVLRFPFAVHADSTYIYRFSVEEEMQKNSWRELVYTERFGEFYLPERVRGKECVYTMSSGYFSAGKRYRVSVKPVSFFGETGKPLTAEFDAPAQKDWKVVFESHSPMKELPFYRGLRGAERMSLRDGYYHKASWIHRLIFPAGIWNAPEGTRFRLTADVRCDSRWSMVLRQIAPKYYPCSRLFTRQGSPEVQRCILEFTLSGKHDFCLQVQNSENGKIRFEYLKIECLLPEELSDRESSSLSVTAMTR